MRKIVTFAAIIAAVLLLVCCSTITAFAADDATIDYEALFARANEVDGYYAEAYGIELADVYTQNPQRFITELSTQSAQTIENATFLLAVEYQLRDYSTFRSTLITLSKTANSQEQYVITSIISHIDMLRTPKNSASEHIEYNFPDRTFNVEVVKRNIVNHLAVNRNVSGEFCSYVSMIYQLSPTLFAEMVSDMSTEDISIISNCIAFDMKQNNITPPAVSTDSELLNTLQTQIHDAMQNKHQLNTLETITSLQPDVDPLSYMGSKPTSVQFDYEFDRDYAYVGDNVTIRVTFTTNKNLSSLVVFRVKLYQYIAGSYHEVTAQSIAVSPGSYDGTFTYSETYLEPGQKMFLVQILDSSGTTSLYTTGSSELNIVGRWSISVDLPEDRWNLGYLTLYDPYGRAYCSDICLGGSWLRQGDNEPYEYLGNTPEGVYTGFLNGPYPRETDSYGPYQVIELTGVSGEIMDCTDRSGFLIHGGRDGEASPNESYYPLYPTNGCIRIKSSFQQTLASAITTWQTIFKYLGTIGDITVTEYSSVSIPSE